MLAVQRVHGKRTPRDEEAKSNSNISVPQTSEENEGSLRPLKRKERGAFQNETKWAGKPFNEERQRRMGGNPKGRWGAVQTKTLSSLCFCVGPPAPEKRIEFLSGFNDGLTRARPWVGQAGPGIKPQGLLMAV